MGLNEKCHSDFQLIKSIKYYMKNTFLSELYLTKVSKLNLKIIGIRHLLMFVYYKMYIIQSRK